jgi:hypothetical protein
MAPEIPTISAHEVWASSHATAFAASVIVARSWPEIVIAAQTQLSSSGSHRNRKTLFRLDAPLLGRIGDLTLAHMAILTNPKAQIHGHCYKPQDRWS